MLNGTNQDSSISVSLFNALVLAGLTNDNSTFSLDDLGAHNVLEHDASFSRQDGDSANPNTFNDAAWNETLQYWTEDTISINTSATAHIARIRTANATNPNFGLSYVAKGFLSGESVAFIMVFGDVETGVAPRDSVTYWFGEFLTSPPPGRMHSLGSPSFDYSLSAESSNLSYRLTLLT